MQSLDLSFYLEPPEPTVSGTLVLEALAPLSMVSAQPGTYFRTETTPPAAMIYGLLENALGWHFPLAQRKDILKGLAKTAKKKYRKNTEYKDHPWLSGKPRTSSKSGYFTLLQYHLSFGDIGADAGAMVYDDLWSMHLRDTGMNFPGGSRHYDSRLETFISTLRTSTSTFKKLDKSEAKQRAAEKYELGDRKEFSTIPLDEVYSLEERKLNPKSFREGYPMYYVSPKKRGFVEPSAPYRVPYRTTPGVQSLLEATLPSPTAPLYLGTSEGWVSASLADR